MDVYLVNAFITTYLFYIISYIIYTITILCLLILKIKQFKLEDVASEHLLITFYVFPFFNTEKVLCSLTTELEVVILIFLYYIFAFLLLVVMQILWKKHQNKFKFQGQTENLVEQIMKFWRGDRINSVYNIKETSKLRCVIRESTLKSLIKISQHLITFHNIRFHNI